MWVIILFKKALAFTICFILIFCNTAYASDYPKVSAKASVALDMSTKTVLFEKQPYLQLPMASTTKIMTCLLACEYGNFNSIIRITDEMLYGTEGTLIYLKPGDEISFLDLIIAALVASGNDAANAIAFTVSGGVDEFCELMNKKAQSLNMKNTYFKTASGLDEKGHYSCAYDMAVLASNALQNQTFKSIVSIKSAQISINGKKQSISNHNKLLSRDSSFIGVKTGFTNKAGRCLVSAYSYRGATIIIVTLNAPDDWDDHLRLVNYSKKKYNVKTVQNKLYIPSASGAGVLCNYSCRVNTCSDVYVKLYYYPFIYSPYKPGDVIGCARVYSNAFLLFETELKIT